MAIGLATGLAGGVALLAFMRRVTLPSEALYPLRTLASVLLVRRDDVAARIRLSRSLRGRHCHWRPRAPYQGEIARFHAALAGLAEIVAFVALGLTIDLTVLARTDVWLPGLILDLRLPL